MFSLGIFAANPDQVALAANPLLEEILGILTNSQTGNQAISDKIDSMDARLISIEQRLSNIEAELGVSCTPGTEICDGIDNDCDGTVDEDVCTPQPVSCDLTSPSLSCGDGIQCEPDSTGKALCTEPAGTGGQGSTCSSTSECLAGFTCTDAGSGSQCLQWCQNDSQCSFGASCVTLSTPIVIDGDEFGVCN